MSKQSGNELRDRVAAFLAQPLPVGMLRGSLAEGMLARYAKVGRLDADEETLEMLQMCIDESLAVAGPGPGGDYLRASAALLQAIAAEISGATS